MPVKTEYQHVVLDEKGVPIIKGTSMKVSELVVERSAYGWSPEELHFQHPYLSLSQIHSALAYYWDHSAKLDQEISRRLKNMERIQGKREQSSLTARLKSQGLI